MIRGAGLLFVALGALMATVTQPSPQDTAPAEIVQILSPAEGAYVAGPTLLRARVDPAGAVQSVIVYVDGQQVCAFSRAPFECEWDAGPTVNEHEVRVVVTFAGGRRAVQNVRTKGVVYTESVDVDVVQVTATVTDGRGHFVRKLPASAFHIFEDGRAQTVSHFESEDVALDLVVALDISGSMAPAMPKLKQAAKEFLAAVPSKDKVTLLAFNDSIFTVALGATNPAERAKGIDRLAPWGTTALYDVIIRGIDILGRKAGRKAFVVFTDGEDQGSRAPIEQVERRLQASDITLYVIGQGRGTSLEQLKKVLRRLSQPTGGRPLFMEKIDELHDAFAELLDELSNQYLLGYSPTNTKRDDTLRRIKVELDGHYSVRARDAYRAAPAPAK
jgi:VWFA-related protein